MSETTPPPETPPLPEVYEIPQEAIARWSELQHDHELLVPFARTHLDNLMISLRQNTLAQIALGEAMRMLSQNEFAGAQAEFRRHQELIRYSYTNLNWFIEHVMTKAQPQGPSNG